MLNLLIDYDSDVTVNGQTFANGFLAYKAFRKYEGEVNITLGKQVEEEVSYNEVDDNLYLIEVRHYMTKKGSRDFTFMIEKNNDIPMPLRVMKGTVLEETPGLIKMKLSGVYVGQSTHCMKCGRKLTHEVSRMYGIGPECGGHFHIAPPESLEAFKEQEQEIREKVEAIEWEGWIIKSAIQHKKVIKEEEK